MRFKVITKLVYFEGRSLYFEQRFVSKHDGFIRAIAICKNTAVNVDVDKMMREEFGIERPECPEDVKKFIECHDSSSAKLKSE